MCVRTAMRYTIAFHHALNLNKLSDTISAPTDIWRRLRSCHLSLETLSISRSYHENIWRLFIYFIMLCIPTDPIETMSLFGTSTKSEPIKIYYLKSRM